MGNASHLSLRIARESTYQTDFDSRFVNYCTSESMFHCDKWQRTPKCFPIDRYFRESIIGRQDDRKEQARTERTVDIVSVGYIRNRNGGVTTASDTGKSFGPSVAMYLAICLVDPFILCRNVIFLRNHANEETS